MKHNKIVISIFISIMLQGLTTTISFADDLLSNDKLVDIITLSPWTNYNSTKFSTKGDIKDFSFALQKFSQANITSAYKDFNKLINLNSQNDFLHFNIAYELCDLGFFSLAQNALIQIEDEQIWKRQIEMLKQVYFPFVTLSLDEEFYLAEQFCNINYGNLIVETIDELTNNNKLLKKSDYANYILSLAYYKEKKYSKALSYVNKALDFEQNNFNYLRFKAQILSEQRKYKESNRIIDYIDSQNIRLVNFSNALESLKAYNIAKSNRNRYESKFLLAKYYLKKNDLSKSKKELNSILVKKRKYFKAYTLLGDISLQSKDFDKAREFYEKSISINKKYSLNLLGLGNVYYAKGDYSLAKNYYEQALQLDEKSYQAVIGLAMVERIWGNIELARKNCIKAFSLDANPYLAYYLMSKLQDEETGKYEYYIKRSLSINPNYAQAWSDLANIEAKKNNDILSQKYLLPVKLIDSDDFRI